MNGAKYLADTNAFIYLLKKHPALKPLLDADWHFCFITEIELLGSPNISKEEVKNIKELLSVCTKLPHTDELTQITISLKQQYRLKVPDALIAATALKQNFPLITFDTDFSRVEPLDIILLSV